MRTFAFSYDRWCGWLLGLLGHGRSLSRITVDDREARVVMGLAFRSTIPRSAIRDAAPETGRRPWSRGVHGWRGRWLVNGSADGLVRIELDPPVQARVMGIPVALRTLVVSVEEPHDLVTALGSLVG